MITLLWIIGIVLTSLVIITGKKLISNKPEIEILFRRLKYLNKELEQAERIDSDKYNEIKFKASGISWISLKLPLIMINKKKFSCKSYQTVAKDYTAFLRPFLVIFLLWILNIVLILVFV